MTVLIVVTVFIIILKGVRRKIVIEEELSDKTLSALDIEALRRA